MKIIWYRNDYLLIVSITQFMWMWTQLPLLNLTYLEKTTSLPVLGISQSHKYQRTLQIEVI